MKTWLFVAGLGALAASFSFSFSSGTEPASVLDRNLEHVLRDNELLGMSVLVMDGGKVAYARGFGLSDADRELPATENTIYRLASISKSVTATALMMLYDEGRVDLDADVSQYLGFRLRNPRFPKKKITLRMLLSHRSSLTDGDGYGKFSVAMSGSALPLSELLTPEGRYFTPDMFLDHEPGTYFTYANCPWGAIAQVVERVSGERFDRFCRQRIFGPLDMDASFDPADLRNLDSLAVLYRSLSPDQWTPQVDELRGIRPAPKAGPEYQPGINGLFFGPQGSLRCSVADLAKFMQLHLNDGQWEGKRLLRPSTVALMRDVQWIYDGKNGDTYHDFFFSWGLGFHLLTNRSAMDVIFPGLDMVGHPGEAYGLISDMYYDPSSGDGVIFATNGSRRPFETGKESTFYLPEEQVFKAVREFLKR